MVRTTDHTPFSAKTHTHIYIYIHIMIHHQSKLEPQHRFNTLRRWPTFMAWHGDPTVHGHLNRINGDELILTVGFWGALLSTRTESYSKNARVLTVGPICKLAVSKLRLAFLHEVHLGRPYTPKFAFQYIYITNAWWLMRLSMEHDGNMMGTWWLMNGFRDSPFSDKPICESRAFWTCHLDNLRLTKGQACYPARSSHSPLGCAPPLYQWQLDQNYW